MIYTPIAPVSQENQGALGVGTRGEGRLTESSAWIIK